MELKLRPQRPISMAVPGGQQLFDRMLGPGCYSMLRNNLPALRISNEIYYLYLVFGRFPAELGPETRSNGSGSKNGAETTQN